MITFKQYLLTETIFDVLNTIGADFRQFRTFWIMLWMFYRTNDKQTGIVALRLFYQHDNEELEELLQTMKEQHPSDFVAAGSELKKLIDKEHKERYVMNVIRNYFQSMEHNRDLNRGRIQGPTLPQRPVGGDRHKRQTLRFA